MRHDADDYLFTGEGVPDPMVRRLESALRPLGHGGPAAVPAGAPARASRPVPASRPRLAAAIVGTAAAAGVAFFAWTAAPRTQAPGAPPPGGAVVAAGTWIETADAPHDVTLGPLSAVTVAPRSRVQVRHLGADETRLYLAVGRLEARVSADARPRFFQIDTDAARCIDLGCRYTIEVDPDGTASVRVTAGQVAFEHDGREVFVPAGALCSARRGRGPGTPRFADADAALDAALDAYDDAVAASAPAEDRRALAVAALACVRSGRDTLSALHLFGAGADDEITALLVRMTGEDAPSAGGAAAWDIWRGRLTPLW